MTKEDWAQVEKMLAFAGCGIRLECDGYKLTVQRARRTEMRDCIVIYVEGIFKGEWAKEDCEERRRFLCPMKSYYHKPKMRAAMRATRAEQPKYLVEVAERALGKLADPDATFTWYSQIWPSLTRLKAHLVKNNKEISIFREAADADNRSL
jgi:hypothetical protein